MYKYLFSLICALFMLSGVSQTVYSAPICAFDTPLTLWVQRAGSLGADNRSIDDSDFFNSRQISQLYRVTEPTEIIDLLLEDLDAIYRYGINIQSDTGDREFIELIGRLYGESNPAQIIQLLLTDISAAYRLELAAQSGGDVFERSVDIDQKQLAAISSRRGGRFIDSLVASALGRDAPVTKANSESDPQLFALQQEAQKSGFHYLVAISELRSKQEIIIQTGADGGDIETEVQNIAIELRTTAVNNWYNRKDRRISTINFPLTDSSTITDLRTTIRAGIREQVALLRRRAVLPRKYQILSRDERSVVLNNSGDRIPLGYEFVPLLLVDDPCTVPLARTTLRTVRSTVRGNDIATLLYNVSLTAEDLPPKLLADPTRLIIEMYAGYVFPIRYSDEKVIVPISMATGGIRLLPVINFGVFRPFFQVEGHALFDNFITYTPVATMLGGEFIFHAGPLVIKPSIAGGVAIGTGLLNIASPFVYFAAGGSAKLAAGLNLTRKFSLFIETGYTHWFIFHDTAHSIAKRNAYVLDFGGYGGVDVALNFHFRL